MAGRGIAVRTSGEVLDGAREHVQQQVASLVRSIGGEVEAVRVRLTTFRQTSAARAALAQVNLTVDGQPIRTQAVAAFVRDTAALLCARLREHLVRLAHPLMPRNTTR